VLARDGVADQQRTRGSLALYNPLALSTRLQMKYGVPLSCSYGRLVCGVVGTVGSSGLSRIR
jgi:hypothetical protein